MIIEPDTKSFAATYQRGDAQLVWHDMVADLETPVAAYMKLTQNEAYAFLLESVEDGDISGRYSMIGLAPDLLFRTVHGKAQVNRRVNDAKSDFEPMQAAPLDALRQIMAETRIDMPNDMPPMAAGIFGYMSYDMVRYMEHLPNANADALNVPECLFLRPTIIAVFDKLRHVIRLVTPVFPQSHESADDAHRAAHDRLEKAAEKLQVPLPEDPVRHVKPFGEPQSNMSQESYFDMVAKARDYIIAGDVFQVVLSQRFSIPFTWPPFDLYRALRRINPSPYLFYLKLDDVAVVGSSPEVLVGVQDHVVNIRPIAGTRKRGNTAVETP